jgi:pyruvate kinase
VTKVTAITRGGYASRMLSARSVAQPIFAISDDAVMARSVNLYSSVEGIDFDVRFPSGSADQIKACIRTLYSLAKLDQNDLILVTGVVYPGQETRMNIIQIHKVSDLIKEFAWPSTALSSKETLRTPVATL